MEGPWQGGAAEGLWQGGAAEEPWQDPDMDSPTWIRCIPPVGDCPSPAQGEDNRILVDSVYSAGAGDYAGVMEGPDSTWWAADGKLLPSHLRSPVIEDLGRHQVPSWPSVLPAS